MCYGEMVTSESMYFQRGFVFEGFSTCYFFAPIIFGTRKYVEFALIRYFTGHGFPLVYQKYGLNGLNFKNPSVEITCTTDRVCIFVSRVMAI